MKLIFECGFFVDVKAFYTVEMWTQVPENSCCMSVKSTMLLLKFSRTLLAKWRKNQFPNIIYNTHSHADFEPLPHCVWFDKLYWSVFYHITCHWYSSLS